MDVTLVTLTVAFYKTRLSDSIDASSKKEPQDTSILHDRSAHSSRIARPRLVARASLTEFRASGGKSGLTKPG